MIVWYKTQDQSLILNNVGTYKVLLLLLEESFL